MYYSMPTYGYGCGCMNQPYNGCSNKGRGGYSYALILVLFILLVIIGAARW
ncbi:MAG: YjcZ family sporulation protein [Anaeroplasmataceae bacterium]|nr:YjcZ family sporulation protein [Anaeroplasmataceae bacterium]